MSVPVWRATSGPEQAEGFAGRGDVVLVHGSLDRSAGMLRLSRQLDTVWRVTRYDRRGYGRSTPHPGPFTVDAHVADLLDVLGGCTPPVVLFGHSYGGNVALALAERRPELVRAVAVYESPLTWTERWPSDSTGRFASQFTDDPPAAAEVFMRRLIGDERWQRLPDSTRAARRAEGPALLGETADLRRAAPWHPERIGVPVLTLYGEHGRPHHRQAMEWVAEAVPDGRVHVVTGAHHFGPNTHPEAVAALFSEFLEQVGVSPAPS